MEQDREQEWDQEWFALPWDEDEYQEDEEKVWERMTWYEDLLVPLDSSESVS